MRFYFDRASSASAPASIRFSITSHQRSGARVRAQSPLHILSVPHSRPFSSQLVPLQPSAGWLRGTSSHRGGSSSQHLRALKRWPATRTRARTRRMTHRNFLRAPILNSLDPPPPRRGPGLAPLGGSAAPCPSLRPLPCKLRGGKTLPGACRP